ncbi:hypothetical protein DFP89_10844 [Paracoccus lutimaris]|uniref:Uncharacterized protein n=1 Tax=Paracoccus lutimaris TaxID=1490030 RepID=A0A368YV60_9RHOB|nr:hypothetical protein DFP89_10844 [Paracoccus lutimaris]
MSFTCFHLAVFPATSTGWSGRGASFPYDANALPKIARFARQRKRFLPRICLHPGAARSVAAASETADPRRYDRPGFASGQRWPRGRDGLEGIAPRLRQPNLLQRQGEQISGAAGQSGVTVQTCSRWRKGSGRAGQGPAVRPRAGPRRRPEDRPGRSRPCPARFRPARRRRFDAGCHRPWKAQARSRFPGPSW